MGNKKRRDRVLRRKEALEAFSTHHGVVLNVLAEVIYDLSDEVSNLQTVEQDQAFCAELHYRLENGARYGDPDLGELNGQVILFIAMAATKVWTSVCRREKLRGGGIDSVRMCLRRDGERMARGMRVRLGRQVKEMRYRF